MQTSYWRLINTWNHIIEMENCVINFETKLINLGTGIPFVNTVMNLQVNCFVVKATYIESKDYFNTYHIILQVNLHAFHV
jgi:hypothetical protein